MNVIITWWTIPSTMEEDPSSSWLRSTKPMSVGIEESINYQQPLLHRSIQYPAYQNRSPIRAWKPPWSTRTESNPRFRPSNGLKSYVPKNMVQPLSYCSWHLIRVTTFVWRFMPSPPSSRRTSPSFHVVSSHSVVRKKHAEHSTFSLKRSAIESIQTNCFLHKNHSHVVWTFSFQFRKRRIVNVTLSRVLHEIIGSATQNGREPPPHASTGLAA